MKPFVGAYVRIKDGGDYLVTEVDGTHFRCIRHSPHRASPYTAEYGNEQFITDCEELVVTSTCLKFLKKYL